MVNGLPSQPRPAQRPVASHEFRGFNGLIGHEVVAWRHGFVEMRLKVRPERCNANGALAGGVLMTLLDSASGFACTFNETATARRLSVTLAFTTQFIKAARDGDQLPIFGARRPPTRQPRAPAAPPRPPPPPPAAPRPARPPSPPRPRSTTRKATLSPPAPAPSAISK